MGVRRGRERGRRFRISRFGEGQLLGCRSADRFGFPPDRGLLNGGFAAEQKRYRGNRGYPEREEEAEDLQVPLSCRTTWGELLTFW